MTDTEHLQSIIRHIKRVEDNCNLLAQKLQARGELQFAINLIKRGRKHDLSKLKDYEFVNLRKDSPYFKEALKHHHKKNSHHPEHYPFNGIREMSYLDLAEMVCDCLARGQEFGTDTRVWFKTQATVKYDFSMDDEIGEIITEYLDLLLTPPFK